MHKKLKEKVTSPVITLGDDGLKLRWIGFVVGLVFLGAAAAISMPLGGFDRFSHAYLMNYCYFASIALGALFFVGILHLTRAGWGVMLRRIAEYLAMGVVLMLFLLLPIIIPLLTNYDGLYMWNADGWMEKSAFEGHAGTDAHKAPYLNSGRFVLFNAIYFAIWIFSAWFFLRGSLKQDQSGDKKISLRNQSFAAPFMLLFAVTLAFASFDWEMTLEPMWFSTMFPVYFFAGAMLGGLAMITLIALMIQRSGRATSEITIENYHDMAKLMFAFVFFWGYIAFSQFMLIWYANIPEETFWYQMRFSPEWVGISILLLFGHLLIPFLGIMARTVRRSKQFLMFAAVYLLIMHWVDHWWIVAPSLTNGESLQFPIVEILIAIGMAGLFMSSFCYWAGDKPLIPVKDPWTREALNYENP